MTFSKVLSIIADTLKNLPLNRRVMINSLSAIAQCRNTDFSGLDWDVKQFLFEILLSETEKGENKKNELLKHCFNAASAFVGTGDKSRDEEIGSMYVKYFLQNCVHELCEPVVSFLFNCKVSSSELLLSKLQYIYQENARSSCMKSKQFAQQICRAARDKVDCFGLGNTFVPSLDAQEAFEYYHKHLIERIPIAFQVTEVMQLICTFANESYRLHQLIDAQDTRGFKWCAAEIVAKELPNRIKVHYTGWTERHDEWIEIPSQRIAPAFTFTRLEMHEFTPTISSSPVPSSTLQPMLSSKHLGISSEDTARQLLTNFNNDVQFAINYARWMNRQNIEEEF
eukprot:TRINITY_DN8520_c0_g1_i2.p1 TRINITY_DN8520_c0_g1~~TRINITY_DN8520_c0_g1_i2.p1  ORF type:complete len:339 (-),score=72.91 TRINITY_DN8520_c0_g1_i2:173-1189(-)